MDYHDALAKPSETIEQHTDKLLECAKVLYDLGYIKSEQLYKDLLVACKNHDMGKSIPNFKFVLKENQGLIMKLKYLTQYCQFSL